MRSIGFALLGVLLAHTVLADPAPSLLLQAEGRTLTPVCTGQGVRLEGNHNVLKPFGVCGSLLIKGIANQVVLDFAANAALRVEGSGNQVAYSGSKPVTVDLLGPDNSVLAQQALVPEPGPVLLLTGDDQALEADCAGRSASVQGNRALYLLRGGCKSLTIHGDLVIVQAEMQPGAPIVITGHGDRVGWVLNGAGKPPAPSVRGEANHIEHLDAIGGTSAR
jgi:hypothetical protein